MSWIWDMNTIDESRYNRALKEKPSIIDQGQRASFAGDHGTYTCTLSHCDCPDFTNRLKGKQPCKHIIAFGLAAGELDPAAVAHMFEGFRAVDELSLAYGRYHLFHAPIMTDEEYDALKRKWSELLP